MYDAGKYRQHTLHPLPLLQQAQHQPLAVQHMEHRHPLVQQHQRDGRALALEQPTATTMPLEGVEELLQFSSFFHIISVICWKHQQRQRQQIRQQLQLRAVQRDGHALIIYSYLSDLRERLEGQRERAVKGRDHGEVQRD